MNKFLPDDIALENEVLKILRTVKSNEHGKTGTEIWVESVRPKIPISYILIAAEAVKLHLNLPHTPSSHIKTSSIKSKNNQLILHAVYTNPDTYENTAAVVFVANDSIGRIKIVLQTAENQKTIDFVEKEAIDSTDFKKLYPNAFVLRLHELPQDVLAGINEIYSKAKLSAVSKELLDFSNKYNISLDCLADRSNSLVDPIKQIVILNLIMKVKQLATEVLYNESFAFFEKIKEMKEEFEALRVPLKSMGLDKLFMERIIKLISRIQETQNQDLDNNNKLQRLVDWVTELITIADWLNMDINKNYLENQSYDAYLLYKENPVKYATLKPMFQWLNFEA